MTTENPTAHEARRVNPDVLGYFEHIDPHVVKGWALHKQGQPLTLYMYLGGVLYPLETTWTQRPDIQQAHGEQHKAAGFEGKLPPEVFSLIWAAAQKGEPFNVVANTSMLRNVAKLSLDSLYNLAKTHVDNKQWQEAETVLKLSLMGKPDDPESCWLLSQVLDKLGRTWEATDACGKAIELGAPTFERHFAHANLLERMNRFEAAFEAFKAAAALEPERFELHYRMGYLLEKLEHAPEAELAYFYATELDASGEGRRFGHGVYHAKRGYWPEAAQAYALTLQEQPQNAELWYRLGMAQDRCYRWAQAAEAFRQAIAIDPGNPQWHYRLGFVLERQADWAGAAQAYTTAVQRKADHDGYWYYRLGTVLAQAGHYAKACEAFEQTRKQKALVPQAVRDKGLNFLNDRPEYLEYLALGVQPRATLYHDVQNPDIDTPLFAYFLQSAASAAEPQHLHIWVVQSKAPLPEACSQLANTRFVPAGSDLHLRFLATAQRVHLAAPPELLDAESETPTARAQRRFSLGSLFEQCRRWELAAQAYSEGLAIDASDVNWHWRRALVLEQCQNWDAASTAYEQAIDRKNEHDAYWYFRWGHALSQKGAHQQACEAYLWTRVLGSPYGVDTGPFVKDTAAKLAVEYTEYFEHLKVREKFVLYESFHGVAMSCNPFALYRELLNDPRYADWQHVWVVNEKERVPEAYRVRQDTIMIKRGSAAYIRYLASAKYLINNVSFPEYFIRKDDQRYLNTWHGTPLKTLGKSIKSPFLDHKNVARNFLQTSHLISPNRHTTNVMLDQYDIREIYCGKLLETGYPRIDATVNATEEQKRQLREKIGINESAKVVLYAPTWRGTSKEKRFDEKKLKSDLKILSEIDGVLLFRGHHLVEGILAKQNLDVTVVPHDVDTNDLLAIVDVLITDYSSIFYDFLPTGRPIIHYVYDYVEYKSERGLYFDKSEWPGFVAEHILDVKYHLRGLLRLGVWQPDHVYLSAQIEYADLEKGQSSTTALEFFINESHAACVDVNESRKSTILFFEGPFIPNGISASFVNLLNQLDADKYISYVAVDPAAIENYPERLCELAKLPVNVRVLGSSGRFSGTAEEQWLNEKFNSQNRLTSKEQWEMLGSMFKREFRRLYGKSNFDVVVNFEGYSTYWTSIFGFGPEASVRNVIYQHNNMYGEWVLRFPYLERLFGLYQAYDRIISVSKPTLDLNVEMLTRKFDLDSSKFDYCVNQIQANKIKILADENDVLADSLMSDLSVRTYINLGRLSPEKDQKKLIDAFAIVKQKEPNSRLLILGDGPLRFELTAKIAKLGLQSSVYLLGSKPNPFPYLKRADCFVLSSNHEGQPMVLLEAMVLGKPVVAVDIPGSRSVVELGYGVLVENNAEALAVGMMAAKNLFGDDQSFDYEEYELVATSMFQKKVVGINFVKSSD